MTIKIKLSDGVTAPSYATLGSAAVDLCANLKRPVVLRAGEQASIPTGIHLDMTAHPDLCALIMPRSGLGKQGLVLGNTVGLIDNDYQGEITIIAVNRNPAVVSAGMGVAKNANTITIEPGMRLAQMMFTTFFATKFEVVEEFENTTKRGTKGFGSTGK